MKRREFIRKAGITGAAAVVLPSAVARAWNTTGISTPIQVVLSGGVRCDDFLEVFSRFRPSLSGYRVERERLPESVNTHIAAHAHLLKERTTRFGQSDAVITSPGIFTQHLSRHTAMAPVMMESDWVEQVIQKQRQSQKEEWVVLVQGFDRAHYDYAGYLDLLSHTVEQFLRLENRLGEETGMTASLSLTADMGRNAFFNEMGGLDHHHASAREIFRLQTGIVAV